MYPMSLAVRPPMPGSPSMPQANALVLITKDDDFRLRHPPSDYRLVWLRCGNITNRALREWLGERWPEVRQRLDAGEVFVEVR